jgi:hypothetical protein
MKLKQKRQQKWFIMALTALGGLGTSKEMHGWCFENIPKYHRKCATPQETGNLLDRMSEIVVADRWVSTRANTDPKMTIWKFATLEDD